ncbi:MAG: hypothetical protein AAFV09_14495, partial [Pseudomonadota bacterium]
MKMTCTAAVVAAITVSAAHAEPVKIEFWHAMGGALGETVNEIATRFNASQGDYELTPVFKGSYEETLTATIAAFRAGEQPNIVQVFDAGAATIIGAPGAVIPAEDLITQHQNWATATTGWAQRRQEVFGKVEFVSRVAALLIGQEPDGDIE